MADAQLSTFNAQANDSPAQLGLRNHFWIRAIAGALGAQTVAGNGQATPTFVSVAASSSGTIPAGATEWTISFVTGTGTLGGVPVKAGFSDCSYQTLAVGIPYTTDASSTAYVRFNY